MPEVSWAGFDLPTCTPWQYACSQPGVILHYLRLAVWPDTLCLDYWWPVAKTAGEILPGALVIGGLLAATVWALWRAPAWGFLGAWFFVILAPTSSIMPIVDLAFEHRMYLPLAAVAAAAVCGVFLLSRRLPPRQVAWAGLALAGLALAALAYRTAQRNQDYENMTLMWNQVVALRPENGRALSNLGVLLAKEDRLDDAISRLRGSGARLSPHTPMRTTTSAPPSSSRAGWTKLSRIAGRRCGSRRSAPRRITSGAKRCPAKASWTKRSASIKKRWS